MESVSKKKRKAKEGYDGKDSQKRKVLSLEWKSEGVMDDEKHAMGSHSGTCLPAEVTFPPLPPAKAVWLFFNEI